MPFKKRAFHVALDANLPILPVVISEYDFLDTSRMSLQPGNVTINVLARIETSENSKETMDSLVSHNRGTMERDLHSLAKTKTDSSLHIFIFI
jgi:lysophosphatidate acyltransferase